MCMEEKKIKTIQIRVTEKDKDLIQEIRKKDPCFNLSKVLRQSLKEYYQKLL